MHIAFLNPQGNFDPQDSYWTEHPDFGGQLVYVKQVALAMAALGHRVDILTRRIADPEWPEFAGEEAAYPHLGEACGLVCEPASEPACEPGSGAECEPACGPVCEPVCEYAGEGAGPRVRILRFPAGPAIFLRKELLWPYLVHEWVPDILAYYARQGRLPDAFTGHYGDGGLCGVLIEARTQVPFTFTAHSLGAQKMDKLGVARENLAQMDVQYHFARRIVAERLSMNRSAVNITSTRQERLEQYGHPAYRDAVDVLDDRRFAVIPPGASLDIFGKDAVAPDEAQTRAHVEVMLARDLSPDRRALPAIIASSRLDQKKNLTGLVRAFAQTPELQARANLVLFTGALNDPLRDISGAHALEVKVLDEILEVVAAQRLRGKISAFALRGQPALGAAYRFLAERGSVFALTSFYEPFGLAPLEAAAAGLPLVVTENGGPSESLREGGTEYGVLVDPTDPAGIARGLLRLLAHRETWEVFAERGHQRVLDRYTWERTAEGYLAEIEALVANPAARRPARLLPVHAYFREPGPETDVTLAELAGYYFG